MKQSHCFRCRASLSRQALAVWMAVELLMWPARANPEGESVVAGSASFSRQGSALQITTSDRVIINWQDFSIGSGELTKFIQPSSASAALNRVISGNPSSILGSLQANGNIYLINPNGILVGAGAMINCGSFIASTLDVNNADFMAGGDLNFLGGSAAGILNKGSIQAIGGDVFLIAHTVENEGLISAPEGTVGLGAGGELLLKQAGEERLFVRVNADSPTAVGKETGVLNRGQIEAASAELKAHGNIYAFAINNEGVVRATGVETKNGRVLLKAEHGLLKNTGTLAAETRSGDGLVRGGNVEIAARSILSEGSVDVSGVAGGTATLQADYINHSGAIRADGRQKFGGAILLEASARLLMTSAGTVSARGGSSGDGGEITLSSGLGSMILSGDIDATALGGRGGRIHVLGDRLGLAGAALDASGTWGGGEILIGGDYQGQGTVQNASDVYINPWTTIRADAGTQGDGGKVILWANQGMDFYGNLSARGGSESGNGGFAEVSGKETFHFGGEVDLAAPQGTAGKLLLDPKNLRVSFLEDPTLLFALLSPNSMTGDHFGMALGRIGTQTIVGAPDDDLAGVDAGAVYLFDGLSGSFNLTLTAPVPLAGDRFGFSVVGMGNNDPYGAIAVGAPGVDTGSAVDAGEVYVFRADGSLSPTRTLMRPIGGLNDQFGFSLAHAGGTRIAVGAPGYNGNEGVVDLFDISDPGPVLNAPVTYNNPDGVLTVDDQFGYSLAASFYSLWVGTPFEDLGATDAGVVYQFNFGSPMPPIVYQEPTPTANAHFGFAVASDGGSVLIGAPDALGGNGMAYAFNTGSASLERALPNPDLSPSGDRFGYAVATDGGRWVVGAPNDDVGALADAGSVYVFDRMIVGFKLTIRNPTPQDGELFGSSLHASQEKILIGAPGHDEGGTLDAGAAYLFTESLGRMTYGSPFFALPLLNPPLQPNPLDVGDQFGTSLAGLDNGGILVGAPGDDMAAVDAGAAYVFDGNGTLNFAQLNPLAGSMGGNFGAAVASVGAKIAIGAPNNNVGGYAAGVVYIFDALTGASGPILNNPTPVLGNGDSFGFSISARGYNSSEILVGAPGDDMAAIDAGVAYRFDINTGALLTTFNNPSPGMGDEFGYSVAGAQSGMAVIGAPGFNVGVGVVYVFSPSDGVSPLLALNNPNPTPLDRFGESVLDLNHRIAVGAPGYNAGSGKVYLFGQETGVLEFQFDNPSFASGDGFGKSLAGGNHALLVGSPGYDAGTVIDAGAAYLFDVEEGTLNSTFLSSSPTAGGKFGAAVGAFKDSGPEDILLVGAPFENSGKGAAYVYKPAAGFIDFMMAPGSDSRISAIEIQSLLSDGIALTLQANNDITIDASIFVSNPNGPGGDLYLQAGRSILINASITTDDGNLSIAANHSSANSMERDPGAAEITMASSVVLNAGLGRMTIAMGVGDIETGGDSGDIYLGGIMANDLKIEHLGPTGGGIFQGGPGFIFANTAAFIVQGGGPGSIGTALNPIKLDVQNLEAATQAGDMFFQSFGQGVNLGGAALGSLAGINVSGDFNLFSAGPITQTEVVSVGGSACFDVTTVGNITLADSGNAFTGPLGFFTGDGDVDVQNSLATQLDASAVNGTLSINSQGAITQVDAINVGTLVLDVLTSGGIILNHTANQIGALGSVTREGALDLFDSGGGLDVLGGINGRNLNNSVTIVTSGGTLTLGAGVVIATSGAGNDVTLAAVGGDFINNSGAGAISTSGGGRFLIYSRDPALDNVAGLTLDFQEFGVSYPTPPDIINVGNGALYSGVTAPPVIDPIIDVVEEEIPDFETSALPFQGPVILADATPEGALTDATGESPESDALVLPDTGDEKEGDDKSEETPDATKTTETGSTATNTASKDDAVVQSGGGVTLDSSGLSGGSLNQMPPVLQQAMSGEVRNELQSAIGDF